MFCPEEILKVYIGVQEYDDAYSDNAFLDCYHDIAYHCTKGYRIVLETENFAISLCSDGVIKEGKEGLQERPNEWLQNGIEIIDRDDVPWVRFETTFFVGERVVSVDWENGIFLVQFDDFLLKIIPHACSDDVPGLRKEDHFSSNFVLGCDRHLKRKCPRCGGDGEILMDFVEDYVVRCKNCKISTWAGMTLIDAIEDWNAGEVECDLSDITIE